MRRAASCSCTAWLIAGLAACGGAPAGEGELAAARPAPQHAAPRDEAVQAVASRGGAVPVSCVLTSAAAGPPADPDAPVRQARTFAEELAAPPPLTPGSGVVDIPDPFTP